MKNSISTNLAVILVTCLTLILGSGLVILLEQSNNRELANAEQNVREIKDILHKSITFSMAQGISSVDPYSDMLREIKNIREIRLIPTKAIDDAQTEPLDSFEKMVLDTKSGHFFREKYFDEDVIRAIDPLLADETCVNCHDARIGEPLALVSVRYSMEDTYASIRNLRIMAVVIVVLCIGITFATMMYLINKRIISDLKKLINFLKKFAVGNVKDSVTTSRKDEIGDAMKSLRVLQMNLSGKTDVATQIADGNLDVKVEVLSAEDELGLAMQTMRDNIQSSITEIERQNWLKTGVSGLNDIMRGEQDLKTLARNIISYLTKYSDAKLGAIYMKNGEDELELVGSYAFNKRKGNKNTFKIGQGLIGQAALERQTILFNNIPEDYISVSSGLGEAVPTGVIVSPLVYEDDLKAVIEIGTVGNFDKIHMEYLNQVAENIAIAINSAQSRQKLQELLEKTQQQAEELQTQQEELRVTNEELQSQQEELRVTNEELEAQAKALKESEEVLKAKHGELITANSELEKQKEQIQIKNADLENTRLELEEKAEQLEMTSKYKSEFLANMSHELRTPMNSIQILSKLLAENKESNLTEKQVEFANTIFSSGTDLLELINEILDLSKIEAGKMVLNLGDLSLTQLQVYLKQNFEHMVEHKGLYLKINTGKNLPVKITTDRQRVEQILKNLISNAIKFTTEGGITVSISPITGKEKLSAPDLEAGKGICISVADTGIGIPKDKQQLIFEAFQQADGTTSRKYGGTGLGLSISRELVKMLHGEIKIQSEPGKGSEFSIFLPFSIEDTIPAETEPESDKEPVQENKTEKLPEPVKPKLTVNEIRDDRHEITAGDRSILVIDDDPRFARILFDLIREKGFKCILAEDGEAGLQMANQYDPSAVILDIGLPRIDGWTVMERLKSNPGTRHIPVYFISAHDRKLDAMKMGAIGYLTKPVNKEHLDTAFDKIESMISKKIKNLLIVEDDKDMRRSIQELLDNSDVKITAVDKGAGVPELLGKKEIDCMVLDLGLKDISGFDLIEKIKSDPAFRDLPVIIYTGRELNKKEQQRLNKYAESIIIKGAKSPERLKDEVSLFLHSVGSETTEQDEKTSFASKDHNGSFKGKKILVVDDDVRNIFALSSVLGEKDMVVEVAENGKEALQKIEKSDGLDLILMDIMMPEMDGYETMRRIRRKSEYHSLPIIALTAKAMKGDRQKCIEAGASDYLSKPIDIEKLLSLMQVWLYK